MLRTLATTIICLIIMLAAAPSQAKLGYPERAVSDNFVLIERLFSNSGAELKEIKLKHWGKISNKSETLPELETKYLVLVKRLGLVPERKTIQVDRDGLLSISQLEWQGGNTIQLFIQSVPGQDNVGATHWGVSIQSGNLEQARKYYELLKMAMRDLGCPEEPGLEFRGLISENLSVEQRTLFLQQLADSAGAQYVEGAVDGQLSSLSLYTQEGIGWVSVLGRKINLNLAMRSIPSAKETNLHIGMPLIYSDY